MSYGAFVWPGRGMRSAGRGGLHGPLRARKVAFWGFTGSALGMKRENGPYAQIVAPPT